MCVTVTRDGSAHVGHERLETPLLQKAMQDAVAAYASKLRAQGRTGFQEMRFGPPRSKLNLFVRADRAASWRAVRRVLGAAKACRLWKIRFLVAGRSGVRDIATFMLDPTDDAVEIRVHVRLGWTKVVTEPSDEGYPRSVSVEAEPDTPFERVVQTIAAFDRAGADVGIR